MPIWKKTIFVNAIKSRMDQENRNAEDILQEYIKLTGEEKAEILSAINS
ncbi:hypothetical protein KQI86_13020 [Clostridium sp. MSJ-11]|uniref:Uncharacterized protein n=1 Tax=Clostridium mobile TaxID=2841512 RepID=A0ABS6EJ70_9CLOT|nr:hypothetical protein [Clostridium mobile]MBU5485258.1 hypothetical protein [Clostridium mobile]